METKKCVRCFKEQPIATFIRRDKRKKTERQAKYCTSCSEKKKQQMKNKKEALSRILPPFNPNILISGQANVPFDTFH